MWQQERHRGGGEELKAALMSTDTVVEEELN
jgi:hypothetical protein